jgi:hypothetical protein
MPNVNIHLPDTQPQHAPLPVPAQEGIREVKVVQYQKVSEHFALPLVNQQKREAAR